jgi:urea transport system substrate-binding protein
MTRAIAIRSIAMAASVLLSSFFLVRTAGAADTIKIGLLEDTSGGFAAAGIPKVQAVQLAVAEINAKGGVLGKHLELVNYDTQSDNTRYQEMARRLIGQDKVDVVFGGYTSASREAIRPIIDRAKMLYFYNMEYEGGVCDSNAFITGPVPEMQFSTALPWLLHKFGPRVYFIGADYNFGQISFEWVKKIVGENGGTIVGSEFIPLDVTQYGQTIQNIQNAKPDFVVTIMVGGNQASFYQQQSSAGLNKPMISSIAIAASHEHKTFAAPTMEGMFVPANFVDELDIASAKEFLSRFHARFSDAPYVGQIAVDSYNAVYLYAAAVEKARTTDKPAVRGALESGICMDGPGGEVCIDPKSHHTSMSIYLAEVKKDHSIVVDQTWKGVRPSWLAEIGCDLTKNPDTSQYTPTNLPK